jgi:hypothetical protein
MVARAAYQLRGGVGVLTGPLRVPEVEVVEPQTLPGGEPVAPLAIGEVAEGRLLLADRLPGPPEVEEPPPEVDEAPPDPRQVAGLEVGDRRFPGQPQGLGGIPTLGGDVRQPLHELAARGDVPEIGVPKLAGKLQPGDDRVLGAVELEEDAVGGAGDPEKPRQELRRHVAHHPLGELHRPARLPVAQPVELIEEGTPEPAPPFEALPPPRQGDDPGRLPGGGVEALLPFPGQGSAEEAERLDAEGVEGVEEEGQLDAAGPDPFPEPAGPASEPLLQPADGAVAGGPDLAPQKLQQPPGAGSASVPAAAFRPCPSVCPGPSVHGTRFP